MTDSKFNITIANSNTDFTESKEIILEYVASLGIDLAFQNFDKEIERLEDMYSAPNGGLILVRVDDSVAGIAGIRKFENADCELKRMYIRPEFRGKGIGKPLLEAAIELAKNLGYKRILLDTYDSMKAAIKLYREYGFVEIEPYRHNPIEAARYFELKF